MRDCPSDPTRRALLVRGAEVAGLVALTAIACRGTPAAAKAAKGDFMYQDHQRDGKNCGQCKFYTPDAKSQDTGSCSIVAGTISRDGWCAAFAPKLIV